MTEFFRYILDKKLQQAGKRESGSLQFLRCAKKSLPEKFSQTFGDLLFQLASGL